VPRAKLAQVSDPAGRALHGVRGALNVVFVSVRAGDDDLYMATRSSRTEPFGVPTRITELSAIGAHEQDPYISGDGRTLYFMRSGRLLVSTREAAR
jgi:Tol biopolymer transport system component